MPKLLHVAPKYSHHKASGQAVVKLNGVDHYLGPWKSKASIAEYDRLTGEWMPRDGGNLLLDQEQAAHLLRSSPSVLGWIRPYFGTDELVKGITRYCLWVCDREAAQRLRHG